MAFITILGIFALAGLTRLWKAFVLTILWGWFAVPLFHLPVLTLVYAFGAVLIFGFITHQYQNTDFDEPNWGNAIYLAVAGPLITLLFGWVAHLFL